MCIEFMLLICRQIFSKLPAPCKRLSGPGLQTKGKSGTIFIFNAPKFPKEHCFVALLSRFVLTCFLTILEINRNYFSMQHGETLLYNGHKFVFSQVGRECLNTIDSKSRWIEITFVQ